MVHSTNAKISTTTLYCNVGEWNKFGGMFPDLHDARTHPRQSEQAVRVDRLTETSKEAVYACALPVCKLMYSLNVRDPVEHAAAPGTTWAGVMRRNPRKSATSTYCLLAEV